ncbi:MAG TPA: radical SAM protein, partial [Ruminococcaceae bacterium]|nr:radical SAM protein [Oscillospiraceae bacterium]
MAALITEIDAGSLAERVGLRRGETLLRIGEHSIRDVLDYQFYMTDDQLLLEVADKNGKKRCIHIEKDPYEDLGLSFQTYLMDKKRGCRNHCVFCFIDQLPKGLRDTLYFKDDDARLSFLMGNYITLTNVSDEDIDRIINMHISPVNVSVHTTNPI